LSRLEFQDIRNGGGVFQGFIPFLSGECFRRVLIAPMGAWLIYFLHSVMEVPA